MKTLLSCKSLKTWFPLKKKLFSKETSFVKAVDGVDLELQEGKIISLVGESGSGKSTLGYNLLGLVPITSGELYLNGKQIDIKNMNAWDKYRKDYQIIYQESYSSLNPKNTIYEIISKPLLRHDVVDKKNLEFKVIELLEKVGLNADHLSRYPHAFSGGQRQRINIARTLGLSPKLI
ncbi:MAG: ATP-binding cassette domain-containing protein, partial [Flavobacteriales bacterium]|nr:ATP-binding cassette domain-containing protein [Flavobacteriales bacterium]